MSRRTPEEALKEAFEAYAAWWAGKPIRFRNLLDKPSQWRTWGTKSRGGFPSFSSPDLMWKPVDAPAPSPQAPSETMPSRRTTHEATRAALESGVIKAWSSGKVVQVRVINGPKPWEDYIGEFPDFSGTNWEWRVKPPQPVALDHRPVSDPPEVGKMVMGYDARGFWEAIEWCVGAERDYIAWAPQPLAPEL